MPALVVFDLFDTLVTSRPLPEPEELAATLVDVLDLKPRPAGQVVRTVYGAVLTAMSDHGAHQPATIDLLDAALRAQGEPRDRAAMDRALWQAFGCADPGQYALCEPIAEAMRRIAEAGHTVRLLSNCFLPGDLMRALLRQVRVPETYERAVFTADGGPKKPDPLVFRLIGEGDFERRVMVGDSEELDIAPAAALGWDTVRVDPRDPSPADLTALLTL